MIQNYYHPITEIVVIDYDFVKFPPKLHLKKY